MHIIEKKLRLLEQQFKVNTKREKKDPVKVHCRCVFDRIVDIDSKNERFDAG
jgi:hypothetical protein